MQAAARRIRSTFHKPTYLGRSFFQYATVHCACLKKIGQLLLKLDLQNIVQYTQGP